MMHNLCGYQQLRNETNGKEAVEKWKKSPHYMAGMANVPSLPFSFFSSANPSCFCFCLFFWKFLQTWRRKLSMREEEEDDLHANLKRSSKGKGKEKLIDATTKPAAATSASTKTASSTEPAPTKVVAGPSKPAASIPSKVVAGPSKPAAPIPSKMVTGPSKAPSKENEEVEEYEEDDDIGTFLGALVTSQELAIFRKEKVITVQDLKLCDKQDLIAIKIPLGVANQIVQKLATLNQKTGNGLALSIDLLNLTLTFSQKKRESCSMSSHRT